MKTIGKKDYLLGRNAQPIHFFDWKKDEKRIWENCWTGDIVKKDQDIYMISKIGRTWLHHHRYLVLTNYNQYSKNEEKIYIGNGE